MEACWLRQKMVCKNIQVSRNNVLPVEQVVSGHHAQEACWISDRIELVVELLELLVQQISSLALCFAAGTPSKKKRGGGVSNGVRDMHSHWNVGKKKALQQSRQYTDLDRFSQDKSTTHTPHLPKIHTVRPPHAWPNFPGLVQHPDGKQS